MTAYAAPSSKGDHIREAAREAGRLEVELRSAQGRISELEELVARRLVEIERMVAAQPSGDREREATTRAIATAMRAEPRRWYLRVCPCGQIGVAGTPCAGFPGAWDDEMGDFARSACLGEVVEVEEVADAPAEIQEDER